MYIGRTVGLLCDGNSQESCEILKPRPCEAYRVSCQSY